MTAIERLETNHNSIVNGLRQAGYPTLANQAGMDIDAVVAEVRELREIIVRAAQVPDFAPRCGDDADALNAFADKADELSPDG